MNKSRPQNAVYNSIENDKLRMKAKQDDKSYLNIVIPYAPNVQGLSYATFQQQFTQPILDIPADYYCSIVRFDVPCQNIPIINFANYIQNFPNVDPNLTIFSVTLEYNGSISQQYVSYVTETPFYSPGTLSAQNPSVAYNNVYYFSYTYSNIVEMLNIALAQAFLGLVGAPVGSTPPYFIYDTNTYKIGLVAPVAYYDQALPLPINVFVNIELFSTFLSGMPSILFGYNEANEQDLQLIIRNQNNNYYQQPTGSPPTLVPTVFPFYVMWQDYPTLINMNSFRNLTFVTNLLPIAQEYSVSNSPIVSQDASTLSVVNSAGIMVNFEPQDTFGWESRGNVTYFPTGPYHLINLKGAVPISSLDITIYWTDQFGQRYPLTIPYNQVITIKLAFFKKDTFTS